MCSDVQSLEPQDHVRFGEHCLSRVSKTFAHRKSFFFLSFNDMLKSCGQKSCKIQFRKHWSVTSKPSQSSVVTQIISLKVSLSPDKVKVSSINRPSPLLLLSCLTFYILKNTHPPTRKQEYGVDFGLLYLIFKILLFLKCPYGHRHLTSLRNFLF